MRFVLHLDTISLDNPNTGDLSLKINSNLTGIRFHKCEVNCQIMDSSITNNSKYGLEISASLSNAGNDILLSNCRFGCSNRNCRVVEKGLSG